MVGPRVIYELVCFLLGMQEANYDDIDQFMDLESSPPAKAVTKSARAATNVRSKRLKGDALDGVVEEVERHSHTHNLLSRWRMR